MFLETKKQIKQYSRSSKLGKTHTYLREHTVALFVCDNCGEQFSRELSKMSSKRLSNNYFHCCASCDAKKFAQRKGVEKKKIWNLPASSTEKIGRL